MKLYDCATAPSPRRVRIFLAEKGISVPTVEVNLRAGEQLGDAFRAINPDCTVPVLVLDNGVAIADVVAICRYFDELQPEPSLMGRSPEEKAVIEAFEHQVEWNGLIPAQEAFRNAAPGLKGRALTGARSYEQIPELAARGRARMQEFLDRLNARLEKSEFVAGPRYTIADITALVAVDFAGWAKIPVPDEHIHLHRWYAAIAARPSTKA